MDLPPFQEYLTYVEAELSEKNYLTFLKQNWHVRYLGLNTQQRKTLCSRVNLLIHKVTDARYGVRGLHICKSNLARFIN